MPEDFDFIKSAEAAQAPAIAESIAPPFEIQPTDLVPDQPDKVRVFKGAEEMYAPAKLDNILEANKLGYRLASQDANGPVYAAKVNAQASQLASEAGGLGAHISPDMPFRFEHKEHENDKIFGSKDGTLRLIDPNGNAVDADDKQVVPFLSNGYQFEDPHAQQALDAYLQMYKKVSNDEAASGAFLQGLGTLGSHGIENIISPITNPDTNNNVRYARIASRLIEEQQHPTAKMIGGIAGNVALSKGLGAFGGANAVRGGVQGALAPVGSGLTRQILASIPAEASASLVANSPQIAIQGMIDRDPQAAAESTLLSIGVGGALGPLSPLANKAIGAMKGTLPAKFAGIDPGHFATAVEQGPEQIQKLNRFIASSPEELAKLDKYFKPSMLEKLVTSDVINNLEDDQRKSVFKDLAEAAEESESKTQKNLLGLASGEKMEGVLSKLDELAESSTLPKYTSMVEDFSDLKLNRPEVAETIDGILNKVEKISEDGDIPLAKGIKLVGELGDEINWKQEGDLANDTKRLMYNSLLDKIVKSGELTAKESGNMKLLNQFLADNATAKVSQELHLQSLLPEVKVPPVPEIPDIENGLASKLGKKIADQPGRLLKKYLKHGATAAAYAVGGAPAAAVTHLLGDVLLDAHLPNSSIPGFFKSLSPGAAKASYVVGDALHVLTQKIDKIPLDLKSLAETSAVSVHKQDNPIKKILGDEANGLSNKQQFKRLSERAASMVGNPQLMNDRADVFTASLKQDYPALADQINNGLKQKISYIHDIMPKDPNPVTNFHIAPPWNPSSQQLNDFMKTLSAINDPGVLIPAALNGTLSKGQIDAVSALYPNTLERMKSKVSSVSHKVKLNYQQRLGLSRFLGQSIDQSLSQTQQMQAAYAGAQAQEQPPAPSGKSPKLDVKKLPAAQGTLSQRISK